MKEIKDLKLLGLDKLNALDEAGLRKELNESSKRYFTLKMKIQLGELKQTHLVTFLRKYMARIKTIASSKGFNVS